jgi:hypothetical protein
MDGHYKPIVNQLIELNFPIEFFLSKIINNLYSENFETDFFLRIMDVIIFDSTIIASEYDKVKIK